jgi:hypothetical protein
VHRSSRRGYSSFSTALKNARVQNASVEFFGLSLHCWLRFPFPAFAPDRREKEPHGTAPAMPRFFLARSGGMRAEAENARWKKEKERLDAALQRARG